jgi:Domain of unknown function (DUF4296)
MTRLTYLFCAAFLWVLTACGSHEESGTERPENLVSEDQMVAVLTEVHLAEAKITKLSLHASDSSNLVYKQLERRILKKYKVDTAAYSKSYIYYAAHPIAMERLYSRIVEKLQPAASLSATTSTTANKPI